MGDVIPGGGGGNPLDDFCNENPNSILCPGGIGWPGSGGGGGGDEDCAIEFPDPDIFAADYDATFTNWYWTSPQLHGFEEVSIAPKQVEVDTDIFVQKLYSVDARGRLGHAGRTNGPQGDTSEYDTPVTITSIEDYAVSAARGLVAQIIADDYPNVIGFTFYALGGTIRQEVGPYDYTDADELGNDLGSAQKIQYFSQVTPGSDDTNDGSAGGDFSPNEFSPALGFHQDDAILEVEYPNGAGFSPFLRISPSNQSISNTSLIDGIAANKTHSTPYVAWTPWYENGISETTRWTNAFIAEYQRLQQEVFLENGRVIKNPVRCWLDSELFPKTYNQQHDKTFGLCQLDPRYSTEVIPGFNKTLKQIVEGTVDQYLDIDEDTTVFDGAGQKVSLSSWTWEEEENGHNGFVYLYTQSEVVKGSLPYTLPQKDGSWITVGSGKWWKNQVTSLPDLSGARRYDFLTFNSWYQSLLTTAFDAALEESVYEPLRAAFPTIKCSNYGSKDLSLPQPMDANNPVSFLGSVRPDVNDNKLYWSREFGGPIISPYIYSVDDNYNPNIEDPYDKRKDYYSNYIDTLLFESSSIEERSLLSSSISPYSRDGVGTLEFEKLPENIVPWIQRPTVLDSNIVDSEETVCDFIRMLRSKGIKEVISWNAAALDQIDDSNSEFNLPGRLGDFDDIYDATARSSITNTNDIKCCRVPSNDSGGWYFQDLGYHFNESGSEITGRAIKNRNDASTYFNTAFPKGGGWSLITMSSDSVSANVNPSSNNQDSPGVGGGIGSPLPTINFRSSSPADRTQVKNLGPIDYEKYITKVEQEVKNLITTRVQSNPYRNSSSRTSDTIVLDVEIELFDVPFVTETGQAFLRNCGSELPETNNGQQPFGDAVRLPGIFWGLNGTRAEKTSKWDIMKDCIIRLIQHTKSVVGHDRVTFYDGPFRFFQNDLWTLLDPSKYNGRTLFGEGRPAEAVRLGISDPGIQEIMAENQYHNMAWYTAKFAHKKFIWDELVNAISEYGDTGVIWTAPSYYTTNPNSGQTDMFGGWSDMPNEYIQIGESTNWERITEGVDLPTNNAMLLNRGIIKYMGDTARASQVKIFTWLRGSAYDDLGVFAPFDEKIDLGTEEGDRVFNEENSLILNSTISNSQYLNGYVFGVTRNDYLVYYDYLFNGLFADSLEEPITIPECNMDISYFTTVRAGEGNNGGVIGSGTSFEQGEIGNVFYLPSYALEASSATTDDEYRNATFDAIKQRINTFLGERDAAGRLLSSYINEECKGKIVINVEHPFSYGQVGNDFPDEDSLENLQWFTEGFIKRIMAARELFPNAQLGIYALGTVHPFGSPGLFETDNPWRFDPLGGQDIQNLPWLNRHLKAMDYTFDGKTITEVADFILPIHWNTNFSEDSSSYTKLLEGRKTYQAKYLIDEILMKHRENHPNNPLDVIPAVSFVSINPPSGESVKVDSKELNRQLFRQFAQYSLPRSKYFITEVASFFDPFDAASAPASKAALENECSGSEYYPFIPDHRPLVFNGIWTQQSPKSWTSNDPTVEMAGGADGARQWGEPGREKYTRRTDPTQGNGEEDYTLTGDVFNANGVLTMCEDIIIPLIEQGFSRFQITNTSGFINNSGYGQPGDPAEDLDGDGVVDGNEARSTSCGMRAFPCNTFTGMSVPWAPNYRSNVGPVQDYINTGHCAWNPGPERGQRSDIAFAHGLLQNTDLDVLGTPVTKPECWLPTPFNPTGTPGVVNTPGVLPNGQGNSPECWRVAIARCKEVAEENGITDLEFAAYSGWRIPYVSKEAFEDARNRQENGELPSEGNYDRVSMGIDFKNQTFDLQNKCGFLPSDVAGNRLFSPDRIPEIRFWDYGWWDNELIPLKELGFTGVGFDAGSNAWAEAQAAGLEPDDLIEKAKGYGLKNQYEAVPLVKHSGSTPMGDGTNYRLHGVNANGVGSPDGRYEIARYWGLFPNFWGCINDLGGEQILDFEGEPRDRIGGGRSLETCSVNLDKSKHEIGVIFDLTKLGTKLSSQNNLSSQLDLTPEQCKRLFCIAYNLGYMIGLAAAAWSGFGSDPEKWGTGQTLKDNINDVREFMLDLTDANRPGHLAAIDFCASDVEPPEPETGVACIDGQCQVITREEAETLGFEIIQDQDFCGDGQQPTIPTLEDGQYIPCLTCVDIPPDSCSPCADCREPNPISAIDTGGGSFVADADPPDGNADPSIISIATPCNTEEVAPDFPPNPPSGSTVTIRNLRSGIYSGDFFFATDSTWGGDLISAFGNQPSACAMNLSYVWEKSTDGGANWSEYQVFDLFLNGESQRPASSADSRQTTLDGNIGDQFRLRVNWSSSCPETSPLNETRIVNVRDVDGGNIPGIPYIITIGGDCEDSGGGCNCTTPDIVIQSEVCGSFDFEACFYPVGVQFIFSVPVENRFPLTPPECVPVLGQATITDQQGTVIDYTLGDCFDSSIVGSVLQRGELVLRVPFSNCFGSGVKEVAFSIGTLGSGTLCTGEPGGPTGQINGVIEVLPWLCDDDPTQPGCVACDCYGNEITGTYGPLSAGGGFVFNIPNDKQHENLFETLGLREINTIEGGSTTIKFKFATANNALNFFDNWSKTFGSAQGTFPNSWTMQVKIDGDIFVELDNLIGLSPTEDPVSRGQVVYNPIEDSGLVVKFVNGNVQNFTNDILGQEDPPEMIEGTYTIFLP